MTTNTETVLLSLASAQGHRQPFAHWLLDDVLDEAVCDALAALPLPLPATLRHDGTREGDNQQRLFVTPTLAKRDPACAAVVDTFESPAVRAALAATCGGDLEGARLRIECVQDVDGFWLEPHRDIAAKRLTLVLYLSADPALADAGTDLFDRSGRCLGSVAYRRNHALLFVPGADTWHGFRRRPIRGLRRSLIVNFVGPEWQAVEQLA